MLLTPVIDGQRLEPPSACYGREPQRIVFAEATRFETPSLRRSPPTSWPRSNRPAPISPRCASSTSTWTAQLDGRRLPPLQPLQLPPRLDGPSSTGRSPSASGATACACSRSPARNSKPRRCFEYHRLPELFGGHPRDDEHPFPAIYPNANPLQAMLGLYPYAPLKMLVLDPHLHEWLPEITLRDLVSDARVTIHFKRRTDGTTSYRILDQRGLRDARASLLPHH